MPSKQIATSTLWQVASQIAMVGLSIISVKFVAIGLTKELAGIYNSSYGYVQVFAILADFGLYAVAVREVSKATDKSKVLGALITLRTIILTLSFSCALLIVWILPQWHGTALPVSVLITSMVPIFTLFAGIVRTCFQVEYNMQYVFLAEVTQRILSTAMIGALIFMGVRASSDTAHLHFMLYAGAAGALLLFAISLYYGNRLIPLRPTIDKALMKSLFLQAAPFGVAYFCLALYRHFDMTLIALLREDFEIQNAYYGFILRMADVGFLLPTYLLNSMLPTLSAKDSKGEDTRVLLGKTFSALLLIGITALLFSLMWSRPLVSMLTTEQYLSTALRPGSDTALRLVSLPMFLNGIIIYSFYVLLNRHNWQALVPRLAVAAICSIVMNIILIPKLGFVGAAYTSIAVHVLLAVILFPKAVAEMPFTLTRRFAKDFAIYTLVLLAGLWLFRPLLLTSLSTLIGLAAMSIIIVATGWFCKLHKSLL
ncbi:MAG: oligosaccharide flippase family protein [bacterium]|nr:oligosaccharide flippase family protein [bacterium]MDA1292546.1 oligosaccharide flippase family protein [bacterium]